MTTRIVKLCDGRPGIKPQNHNWKYPWSRSKNTVDMISVQRCGFSYEGICMRDNRPRTMCKLTEEDYAKLSTTTESQLFKEICKGVVK